jgi:hypothetical protein
MGFKLDKKAPAEAAKPKSEKEFAAAADKGKPASDRNSLQRVNFDLDNTLYQHLRREAFERNVSQAEILREMIAKRYGG